MSQIPTLTTTRLVLRPFTLDDVDPLHEILQQENIMAYFPGPKTPPRDAIERLVQAQLREWTERGYGWWAVSEKDQPAYPIVGWCGLGYLPDTDETEVAYLQTSEQAEEGEEIDGAGKRSQSGAMPLTCGREAPQHERDRQHEDDACPEHPDHLRERPRLARDTLREHVAGRVRERRQKA